MTMTKPDLDGVAAELGAAVSPETRAAYRARYNLAPTQRHVIICEDGDNRTLVAARWGLSSRGRVPMMINLRAERIRVGGYRALFESRRCLIPVDGFYEWTGSPGQRKPIRFHRPDGGLLYFAGVFEVDDVVADELPRFAVLTTAPNELVAPIHNRMPAVVAPESVEEWLRSEAPSIKSLLGPAPIDLLVASPASERANSARNDDPTLFQAGATA
jgi:putative SOS response-associated peptidase YedK